MANILTTDLISIHKVNPVKSDNIVKPESVEFTSKYFPVSVQKVAEVVKVESNEALNFKGDNSENLDSNVLAPSNWKSVYDRIVSFRESNLAPVDTIGCGCLAQKDDPKTFRFQTLIALMLSSQTKDQVTSAAIASLQAHPDGGLTAESILAMDNLTLDGYICKVGFHNRKTIFLKKTARILKEQFEGDIPKTVEKLMELPGVGPKMAYLCMQCAWFTNVGIGVDTHVHRISKRLGWVSVKKSDNPEKTREELEQWLPKEYWTELNPLLVGFGQIHCTPIKPLCETCPVAELCPKIGLNSLKSQKKKKYL
ncbi:DNA N-glycosylase and apurinic/apyrimidinic (AP) lyase [Nowakowskiella sp. JEL0078]|nr:DNA N-glycosylase and apurinic/apyrimidinic (AP) lyase [Nowakowskiella sp. JEL0078]